MVRRVKAVLEGKKMRAKNTISSWLRLWPDVLFAIELCWLEMFPLRPIPACELDPQIPQSSWGKEPDRALIPFLEKSARLGQITFVMMIQVAWLGVAGWPTFSQTR